MWHCYLWRWSIREDLVKSQLASCQITSCERLSTHDQSGLPHGTVTSSVSKNECCITGTTCYMCIVQIKESLEWKEVQFYFQKQISTYKKTKFKEFIEKIQCKCSMVVALLPHQQLQICCCGNVTTVVMLCFPKGSKQLPLYPRAFHLWGWIQNISTCYFSDGLVSL